MTHPNLRRLLLAGCFVALFASRGRAAYISATADDAGFVSRGLSASIAGNVGEITGRHQSGTALWGSVTMLTSFNGDLLALGSFPQTQLSQLGLTGFGVLTREGQSPLPFDGKPRKGIAVSIGSPSFVNTRYFQTLAYSQLSAGSLAMAGTSGDSGGLVEFGGQPVAIMSASVLDTETIVSRLDAPEALDFINSHVHSGEIWGVTGAHVAQNFGDPVTLTGVTFGDSANPTARFNISQLYVYPGSTSSGTSVDFNHPDLALVQLTPVPEPSGVATLFLAATIALLRRRRIEIPQ